MAGVTPDKVPPDMQVLFNRINTRGGMADLEMSHKTILESYELLLSAAKRIYDLYHTRGMIQRTRGARLLTIPRDLREKVLSFEQKRRNKRQRRTGRKRSRRARGGYR